MTLRRTLLCLCPLLLAFGASAGAQVPSPSLFELAQGVAPQLGCGPTPAACDLDKLTVNPGSGELVYRYVPLCTDGSGDHEWTLDSTQGRPPSCQNASRVRCVDGTRPVYWYDRAVNVAGQDIATDRWAFFQKGGSNCATRPAFGLTMAQACGTQYFQLGGAGEMGTRSQAAHRDASGILSPAPQNGFAAYNRVYPWKCSFDVYAGQRQYDTANDPGVSDCHPDVPGDQPCQLWFHGKRMWQAMLRDLVTGNPNLPNLGLASDGSPTIVLTGNSNGARGLTFNLDWLSALLTGWFPGAQVFGVLDNHFNPGVETEAAFDPVYDTSGDGAVDAWEAAASGVTDYARVVGQPSDFFPVPATGVEYQPGGDIRRQLDTWLAPQGVGDRSCVVAHLGAEQWRCYSEEHVLMNHVTTPVFLHQTLQDVALRTKAVDYQPTVNWQLDFWQPRVLHRMDSWLAGPPPFGHAEPRAAWPAGAFMRDDSQHTNIIDDVHFFDRCLQELAPPFATRSYHDAVLAWVQTGVRRVAIEHPVAGADEAVAVVCP